jgi:hypothetical protein
MIMFGIKPSKFTEFCGWYGMLSLIIAYGLVSFGIIYADGLIFQIMNLTGGIGLIVVAASKKVLQSVILNIFWMLIGLIAIIRIFF